MCSLDTVVDQPIDRAEGAVREVLAAQGFGILTEIDVDATFEASSASSGPPLKILGACNPALPHRALEIDPRVALVLPCNVATRGGPSDLHLDRRSSPTHGRPGLGRACRGGCASPGEGPCVVARRRHRVLVIAAPQSMKPCARRKARCSSCISSGSRVNQSSRSGVIANASPSGGVRWVRKASPTGQSRPSRAWLGYSM